MPVKPGAELAFALIPTLSSTVDSINLSKLVLMKALLWLIEHLAIKSNMISEIAMYNFNSVKIAL